MGTDEITFVKQYNFNNEIGVLQFTNLGMEYIDPLVCLPRATHYYGIFVLKLLTF